MRRMTARNQMAPALVLAALMTAAALVGCSTYSARVHSADSSFFCGRLTVDGYSVPVKFELGRSTKWNLSGAKVVTLVVRPCPDFATTRMAKTATEDSDDPKEAAR